MRTVLVLAGVWVSLLVAAAGVWLWTGQPGPGLVAAGLASAAVLFLGVSTAPPGPDEDPRAGRRTPGL